MRNEERGTRNEADADLDQLFSLIPDVIARSVPTHLRDEAEQDIRVATWVALTHGSSIDRPLAYFRVAAAHFLHGARRASQRMHHATDPALLDAQHVHTEITRCWDIEVDRERVKRRLDRRRIRVYELPFESKLPIRAIARTVRCDPRQVRRDLDKISRLTLLA